MTKVIATDLDGTLFYPKRKRRMIPSKSLKLISDFTDKGGEIVLVTGRSYAYTKLVEEKIGKKIDVIAMNGTFIRVGDKVLNEQFLDSKATVDMLDKLNDKIRYIGTSLFTKDYPLILAGNGKLPKFFEIMYKMLYRLQGIYAEKFTFSNKIFDQEIHGTRAYKLMLYFGLGKIGFNKAAAATKFIKENYGDSFEASWTSGFIEITPKNCMKANGLRMYLNEKGYKDEEIVVIGDAANDVPMFKEFHQRSFCMSHAKPEIRKHAKYILKRFHDVETYL